MLIYNSNLTQIHYIEIILDDENVDVISNTDDEQTANDNSKDYILDDDILDEIYKIEDDQISTEDSQDEIENDIDANSTINDSSENQKDG